MKKIKVLLYSLLFIFAFQILINFFIFLYKPKLEKSFFPNSKIGSIFYIFPNIFLLRNIYISSEGYFIHIKHTLFYLNIFEAFKKNFTIHSLRARNIQLEISDMNNKELKSLDKDFIKEYVFKFLSFFPTKTSVKNIVVKYKNYAIIIDRISRITKENLTSIETSGKWNKYVFNFNIDISDKNNNWLVKGTISLPEFSFGLNTIEVKIFGDFDFSQSKSYLLNVIRNNTKYITVKGNIKFLPFELIGYISSDIIKGNIVCKKDGFDLNINYDGVFDIKLPKFLNVNFSNIQTTLIFSLSSQKYKINSEISHPDFFVKLNMENNKGFGYISVASLREKIPFNILYTDKNLFVYNNFSKYPLNFKVNFSQQNIFSINGKIFDYLTDLKFKKEDNLIEINGSSIGEMNRFKLKFFTDFSSSSIKFIYDNPIKNSHFVFDSFLKEDSLNFILQSKKLKVPYFDEVDFSANGEIRRIRKEKDKVYSLINMSVSNLCCNNYKIADVLSVIGRFDKKDISLSFGDKYLVGNLSYDILKNYGNFNININRKKIQLDKFKANFICDLQGEIKQNRINLKGNYKFDSIYYNDEKFLNSSKGEIFSSFDEIILEGKLTTKYDNSIDYKIVYNFPKKELVLKTKNINFFPNFKNFDLFNIEIITKLDKITSFNNINLSGKIYNENSEIFISSFVVLDKGDIKTYYRIKNLKIKNINFVGDGELVIKNSLKDSKNFKLCFYNFWINEQPINKICLDFSYNTLSKELIFLPNRHNIGTDVYFSGRIYFYKKFIKFVNFKIFDKNKEYFLCDGIIGNDKDILKVTISEIPLELVRNFFNVKLHNIKGLLSSDVKILTIDSEKRLYQISCNFVINSLDIETISINSISGKLSFYSNYLNFENIDVVFKEDKKINVKGSYNVISKIINVSIISNRCDLSIFEGFQNIVKSASGSFVVNVKIAGNITSPKLQGYLNISKGKVEFSEYLKYMENIDIKLIFNDRDIKIEKFSGKYENTNLNVSGKVKLFEDYNLSIKTTGGDGIFIKIPQLSFPVGQFFKIIKGEKFFPSNGNVHLNISIVKSKKKPTLVSGSIVLNNTHFTYPGVGSKGKFSSFGFYHNIDLIANNNVWYENEYLSANISGKINFFYNEGMKKMNINGEVEALRGKINFLNTNFDLTLGKVEIIDRSVYIQLVGETNVITAEREKIPINLIVERSKIEDIKPKLVSSLYPELKTEEITALLLGVGKIQKLGDRVSILSSEKIDYLPLLRTQLIKMIDSSFATPIARNILKRWGIADNFSVVSLESQERVLKNEETLNTGSDKFTVSDLFNDTKYVIEKYLTPDM
ncbi:MAG: translocation/assembly module TamB domain-containing protein, partial [Endomicrobia bacterium]|nr:translocation/assembly module TamB domain-containing protein [Endomicrobiia bacterium]